MEAYIGQMLVPKRWISLFAETEDISTCNHGRCICFKPLLCKEQNKTTMEWLRLRKGLMCDVGKISFDSKERTAVIHLDNAKFVTADGMNGLRPEFSVFLESLLSAWDRENCEPILLRNYEGVPNRIGNDLDVFIPRSRVSDSMRVLRRVVSHSGLFVCHVHERDYFTAIWLGWKGSSETLHIDLYHGAATWHGVPFLDEEKLKNEAMRFGPWRVPRPAHEALISGLASVLWGGFFKKAYKGRINQLLSDSCEQKEFKSVLISRFGEPGKVFEVWLGSANYQIRPELVRRLRANLIRGGLRRSLVGHGTHWLRHWFRECFVYVWHRPGKILFYPGNEISGKELRERMVRWKGCPFGGVVEGGKVLGFAAQRAVGKNWLVLVCGEEWRLGRTLLKGGQLEVEILECLSGSIEKRFKV